MDNFINLAKEGFSAYESSQNQGQSQNQNQNQGQQSQQGQGAAPNINPNEVVQGAQAHAQGSGDAGLFSEAMSFVNNNSSQHTQPVNQSQVQDAHDQAYNQGNASNLDAGGIGGAAALQMLKQFTSGGTSSGSGSQSQLVSMAMGEAAKLFDQSGGGTGGTKQDAVNSAGMTVMKLLVQSQMSNMIGGGNSGGLGSMMSMASMASKFI